MKGGEHMVLDDIFEGDVEWDVPAVGQEYGRKMPGHADANGDHCNS